MPQLVEDYRKCNKLCKETPKCKLWQLTEGFCYLKNEAGKLKPGGYLAVSGSRNCNSTSSKHNLFTPLKMSIPYNNINNVLNNTLVVRLHLRHRLCI